MIYSSLPEEDYKGLPSRSEDLEDALALQEARAETTRLRPYHEFREELVSRSGSHAE